MKCSRQCYYQIRQQQQQCYHRQLDHQHNHTVYNANHLERNGKLLVTTMIRS